MRLDITEILREVGKNVPYDIQEAPLVDEDIECTKPIEGRILFTNAGGTLLVRGQADTKLALPCSRCMQYYEQPVGFPIEESFELRQVAAGPRTMQNVAVVEEDESPIAGKLFDGNVFDLTEMLRQYLLLEQPTRPLPPCDTEGRCLHCHRLPEEVLGEFAGEAELPEVPEEEEPPINPAFARLGQLLDKNE